MEQPKCAPNTAKICKPLDGKDVCKCEPVQTCVISVQWEPNTPHNAQITHANCDAASVTFALSVLATKLMAASK